MYAHTLSLSVETDHIGNVAGGKRAVFYEEMAQFGSRYISGIIPENTTVEIESRYHLNNLFLLSMYFDTVFIQTAALFNNNDLFLRAVIQRVIGHPKFHAMLKCGALRICGWGGVSPREMFANAWDFASQGVTTPLAGAHGEALARLFTPSNLTYRLQGSGQEEAARFRARLQESEAVSHPRDLDHIERAIDKSVRLMGEMTAIGLFPALDTSSLQPGSGRAIYNIFVESWNDHLSQSVPGVYNYLPFANSRSLYNTVLVDGRPVHSFLYNPRIFAAFLQRYFSLAEYNRILSHAYEDIHQLRNGDWKRFCDAYHAAVEFVSDSLSDMDFELLQMFGAVDQAAWGHRIWEGANKKGSDFDVNAFIQSLAGFAAPLLFPVVRVAGALVGKRINSLYDHLTKSQGSKTSPYIRKVRRYLLPQHRVA